MPHKDLRGLETIGFDAGGGRERRRSSTEHCPVVEAEPRSVVEVERRSWLVRLRSSPDYHMPSLHRSPSLSLSGTAALDQVRRRQTKVFLRYIDVGRSGCDSLARFSSKKFVSRVQYATHFSARRSVEHALLVTY